MPLKRNFCDTKLNYTMKLNGAYHKYPLKHVHFILFGFSTIDTTNTTHIYTKLMHDIHQNVCKVLVAIKLTEFIYIYIME